MCDQCSGMCCFTFWLKCFCFESNRFGWKWTLTGPSFLGWWWWWRCTCWLVHAANCFFFLVHLKIKRTEKTHNTQISKLELMHHLFEQLEYWETIHYFNLDKIHTILCRFRIVFLFFFSRWKEFCFDIKTHQNKNNLFQEFFSDDTRNIY